MITKKKLPWFEFILLLFFMLIVSYLLCGVTKVKGFNLLNIKESLIYVLLHPFKNWFNKYTPGVLGVTLALWFLIISHYSNTVRNHHFGKEKGTEDWGDLEVLSKILRDENEENNTYLSKHIAIGRNTLSNMNMLVVGGSGSYKTTSVLTPNLLAANMTNVFLDIKGDLLRKHGNYLKDKGIKVKTINFINTEKSDRYNPFKYIRKETDVIKLINTLQVAVRKPDSSSSGDPFWDDGVALYLQALFFFEWYQAKEENRDGTMNNILDLVNMESKKIQLGEEEVKTELQIEMDKLATIKGSDYPPVRDYRKLKEGATETVRSIIIMVNAMLRLCEVNSIKRILEDDDIDLPSLGLGIDSDPTRKTALFLVMPDNDDSFNFLISMFYTQLFDELIYIADNECNGSLPIHVRLWADEFYAGPKPNNPEKLLGTIRSRNISMVPILQDIAQIKTLFQQDKWDIFMANCAALIYLGSGPTAYSTHEYISKLLGEMTIDTRTDGVTHGSSGSSNINNAKDGRALMTPSEVKRIDRKHCLLFLEGQYPIYDEKALPFNTKEWIESEEKAGEKGYVHPVDVFLKKDGRTYCTTRLDEPIVLLDGQQAEYYRIKSKYDDNIAVYTLDEEEFLFTDIRSIHSIDSFMEKSNVLTQKDNLLKNEDLQTVILNENKKQNFKIRYITNILESIDNNFSKP